MLHRRMSVKGESGLQDVKGGRDERIEVLFRKAAPIDVPEARYPGFNPGTMTLPKGYVQELSRVIQRINKASHLTIFVVEQDVPLALSIAHRGYVIENGRITDQGDAKSLLCSARIKEAYLGTA